MNMLLLFAALGAITFLLRLSFIGLLGQRRIPPALQIALRFVPLAILTAITVPEIVMQDGRLITSLAEPKLIAGVVAVLVAARTRKILPTLAAGMATLWLARWVLQSVS
ncbi:MAG: AzlD domain-containing protein [Microvirgula sp.]